VKRELGSISFNKRQKGWGQTIKRMITKDYFSKVRNEDENINQPAPHHYHDWPRNYQGTSTPLQAN
jgi:hypothetical protein